MSAVTPPDPLPPDENVGPILLGVSSVLIALVIITTGLRVWVRSALRCLEWDDYTMIIVTFLGIARYATQVAQISIGNGRHRWYIPKENYIRNNMLGWVAQILLFASICLLKVSILLLLLRIKNSRGLRWSAWAVMAGLVITNFGCIVILLAECDPVEAYWTGSGKCWDARVRIYAIYLTIAYSIVTDIICSLLPMLVIWKVRLPLKTKISVWALMSLGLIATGFGIARAASLGIKTSDLSWVYAITAIWSNLELYLGIVGANLALSRSIYGYFFNKNKSNVASSYAQSGSNLAYNNSGFRHDTFPRSPRAPSPSRSDNSDIPLEPRNKMQSNIWVREDPSKESIGRAT
ncbi:hypothetical protein MRS44_011182 [Fusarium solani]|uniref:uncharacterized protein n=1 Tax=Fusarium solani TaxID=169388 RepID=UPI0032C47DE0|nr:hypothetical protein MRS44_011182 [Fusarium solani]